MQQNHDFIFIFLVLIVQLFDRNNNNTHTHTHTHTQKKNWEKKNVEQYFAINLDFNNFRRI